ncbi:MAG: ABC transporter ATP-binding protein [Rubrivivax sp.]|nr:ABC transporter ATP-binding protein [Rubrivivax sp.]MCL4695752.1 ABC transporter ATP-binding protein [Burkholderiaceae bacterium]
MSAPNGQNQSAPSGLELRGVVKRFGEVTVVQRLDLAIAAGEFMVLLGESGCGKTTTLRMIAGLEEVTEGHVLIGGRDVTALHPMARDIAMVFQNYALYPHMDVAKNMSFALRLAGRSQAEIEARVAAAAKVLNIEHLLARKPKDLSGGQRQRVAIGRAIVREPQVFLFDEPLSNLDAKLRGHMRAELALLHERLGKTTVYVTHDQVEAMTLASRICIFDKGLIQQVGTPAEVFNRPANRFVAGFVGTPTMNFFALRCAGRAGELRLQAEGIDWVAPHWLAGAGLAPGTAVTLGIRPQALRPAAATDAAGMPARWNRLAVQCDVVEYLGNDSQVVGHLAADAAATPGMQRVTAVVPGDAKAWQHRRGEFAFDPEDAHAFAADNGCSLRG